MQSEFWTCMFLGVLALVIGICNFLYGHLLAGIIYTCLWPVIQAGSFLALYIKFQRRYSAGSN